MKIKFGAIVTDGRNKIGGHVASKNRSGNYLRTKVTPVNPNTASQLAARSSLSDFAQGWRSLTEAQRAAWNAAVSQFSKTDIFGDIKNPTGLNLYVKINTTLALIGQAPVVNPPVPTGVSVENIAGLAADVSSIEINLEMTGAVPAGTYMVVRATSPQSAGKSFFKSEFRNITVLPPAEIALVNLQAAYELKFGAFPQAGKKISVEVFYVNAATGLRSASQSANCIVTA